MNDLKVNNVVELRSGSVPMTIVSIEGDKAECTWFDKNKVQVEIFSLDSLVIFDMDNYLPYSI